MDKKIKCSWRQIPRSSFINDGEYRSGRYHGSMFPDVKHYGSKQWVVAGYLSVEHSLLKGEGLTEDDILQGCLDFLNTPPEKKKYAKKEPKPLYGKLETYQAIFKSDKDGDYIEVLLITDEKKNDNFWGEGLSI